MALTPEEVRRVAALARLELSAAEEELFAEQLSRVLDEIDRLDRFEAVAGDADGSGEAVERAWPADDPAPGLDPGLVLANAPASWGPFVAVPRVLEGDD
jgi:aspartyl-tRNA(Asn)/glutamyl-tRNA(Gln) amidotransferase subunit C